MNVVNNINNTNINNTNINSTNHKKKIPLLSNLLKLLYVKEQLKTPDSHIKACKPYIFGFAPDYIEVMGIRNLLNNTKNKNITDENNKNSAKQIWEILEKYDSQKIENILNWFYNDSHKNTNEINILKEHLQYNASSILREINENKFIQHLIHFIRLFGIPLFICFVLIIGNIILIYSMYLFKFQIRFPINTFIEMVRDSLLFKNNLYSLSLRSAQQLKVLCVLLVMISVFKFSLHLREIIKFIDDIESIYYKIYDFERYIILMMKLTGDKINYMGIRLGNNKLFENEWETITYFKKKLNIYMGNTEDKNWWFMLKNAGNIISDFYIISNKKIKLKKLSKINGKLAYIKTLQTLQTF